MPEEPEETSPEEPEETPPEEPGDTSPEAADGPPPEEVPKRSRRRRLRETYQEAIDQGDDTSIVYVMKVLNNVNEIGILIDASFSWLEQEIRNLSTLGFDTGPFEHDLKRMEQEFEHNNHINAITTAEKLAENIKNKHMDYFMTGSSMIISSIKRRVMEYESIGIAISPLKKALQESIESIRSNQWEDAWIMTRRINTAFTYVEKAVEDGAEENLDLTQLIESIGEPIWDIDTYLVQIHNLMNDIPIDDSDMTFKILSSIKSRIMDAKAKGKNTENAIEIFMRSEPEIKESDNLKALIWAKLANDELLLVED